MRRTSVQPHTGYVPGFALIAVLVALSILLALSAPFLLSMGHGDVVARALVEEKRVDLMSKSARDALLAQASLSAPTVDLTPLYDSLEEFPSTVELPAAFDEVYARGRVSLGGEVWDLQRQIELNSASPLVLANLLGLGARLAEDHEGEYTEIKLDDAANLPESGFVVVNREVIRYGSRDATTLSQLDRGLLVEEGFRRPVFETTEGEPLTTQQGTLVLDLRTVLACHWPCWNDRTRYEQYTSVSQINNMSVLGLGGFDAAEVDELAQHCTVGARQEHATTWGKPERVFGIYLDEFERPIGLRVQSAADIGAGSLVRIRSMDGRLVEYGLVYSTTVPQGQRGQIQTASNWGIILTTPMLFEHQPVDTVVERLVPIPVNVNTASEDVLTALIQSMRVRSRSQVAGGQRESGAPKPYFSRREAEQLATRIIELRENTEGVGEELPDGVLPGPFTDWEAIEKRLFKPLFTEATGRDRLRLLVLLYDNFQNGRPGGADMGTIPLTFRSSQVFGFRGAALRHNPLRGGESARLERQGVAIALPGRLQHWLVDKQAEFEELFRLDRHAPFWLTYPINTAALQPFDRGTDPSVRTFAHVVADAYPEAGFGQPRFPDKDGDEGGVKPAPSSTPFQFPQGTHSHEGFSIAFHPEGRDVVDQGTYEIDNSGPAGAGGRQPRPQTRERINFPMTHDAGLTSRHAVQFWFRLDDSGPQALFELSVPEEGFPDRNRITLQLRDQSLILEVLDEAGLDPEQGVIDTVPQRASGRWEVPVADINLTANQWYHASFSAMGNRPGQLQLLVDGVPRGEPLLRTYLARPIGPFQFSNQVQTPQQQAAEDAQLQPEIVVESTQGFPPRGVLRIGSELFEYTSIAGNAFRTILDDSFGGRLRRQRINELVSNGIPDGGEHNARNKQRILGASRQAIAPEHNAGAAVELYGYSLPAYPQRFVEPGSARLTEAIGAFTVARVINRTTSEGADPIIVNIPIQNTNNTTPLTIGNGIDDGFNDDILLGNPTSEAIESAGQDPRILAGFNESGGFALLVQRPNPFGPNTTQGANDVPVGGIEVIRYGSRQGNRLTGIQRGVQIQAPGVAFFDRPNIYNPGQPIRRFVTSWNHPTIRIGGQPPPADDDPNLHPTWYTHVVPLSLSVGGAVTSGTGTVEWAQIYAQNNEVDTEWVRYNTVLENRFLVRAEQRAWEAVLEALVSNIAAQRIPLNQGGGSLPDSLGLDPYPAPVDPRPNSIGYIDPVEVAFPACHYARLALGFRGDRQTGTSSHAHNATDPVLPVHRFEFDWSRYGATAPRAGRNDRIGLAQGSARANGQVPTVEWHTVNWTYRHYASDLLNQAVVAGNQRNPALEDLGPYPFQLVAFKAQVNAAYLGAADQSRDVVDDSRLLDRAMKYPSGELPAADIVSARVGEAGGYADQPPMRGVIDELSVCARLVTPRRLDSTLTESGRRFFIRNGVVVTPQGPMTNAQPRQWPQFGNNVDFPADGGLLWIDGELLAYQQFDRPTGEFQVAANGRGLLGTQPRTHDVDAMVYFVDQVPTGILAQGANERDYELVLNRMGTLPPHGGTVLLGTELLHYTWSEGANTLAMPRWRDPDEGPDARPEGLFRGRYGTNPVSASAGSPVIWFPFRYWDRFRERADDPAMGYLQFTYEPGPSFFQDFGWTEEGNSELVDLQCYVRVDGRGKFDDDPEETFGLFRLRDGQQEGRQNPIGLGGSRIELRFVVQYRPGSFDAQQFLAQDWKFAPVVRDFLVSFESEGRILTERVSAR